MLHARYLLSHIVTTTAIKRAACDIAATSATNSRKGINITSDIAMSALNAYTQWCLLA